MWQELYDECEKTKKAWPGYTFAPDITDENIFVFEREYKIKLPKSYIDYAKVFGAGMLISYRISVPNGSETDHNLDRFHREMTGQPDEDRLADFVGEESKSFLLFCSSEYGDFYGWKIDEVTDENNHEYAIYEFTDGGSATKIADTFQEFIFGHVLIELQTNDEAELAFMIGQIAE